MSGLFVYLKNQKNACRMTDMFTSCSKIQTIQEIGAKTKLINAQNKDLCISYPIIAVHKQKIV